MTRHLELEAILGLATGTDMDRVIDQKPTLSLAWLLDRQTGKPIARWIALPLHPSAALEGE
jgi:hypothetical protein